jgi:hypothetical protein
MRSTGLPQAPLAFAAFPLVSSRQPVIERRGFVAMVGGGLLAGPLAVAAWAQQPKKVHRVGILSQVVRPASSDRSSVAMLLPTALQQLGYAEGQNLVIERRFAEGQRDRLLGLARGLVELQMEAIVAISNEPSGRPKTRRRRSRSSCLAAMWSGKDSWRASPALAETSPGS